jgi:hypothetical protein
MRRPPRLRASRKRRSSGPPGGIKKFQSTLPRPREQSGFAKLVEKPIAQRRRKSAASLSIVSVLGNERPAPPDDLSEFQREVWQRTVASGGVDVLQVGGVAGCPPASDISKRYHPTSYMLRARPGGAHGPPGGI